MACHPSPLRLNVCVRLLVSITLLSSSLSFAEMMPQHTARLSPGMVLFASPELGDPNFVHTIILLIHYNNDGAIGVVVNRPTTVLLTQALPDLEGVKNMTAALFFGGPVAREQLVALIHTKSPMEQTMNVFDDVHATWSRSVLMDMLKEDHPENMIRVYSGYAGWGPGQLDQEVLRGDWKVTRPDTEMIFSRDPSTLWPLIFDIPEEIEVHLQPRHNLPS